MGRGTVIIAKGHKCVYGVGTGQVDLGFTLGKWQQLFALNF